MKIERFSVFGEHGTVSKTVCKVKIADLDRLEAENDKALKVLKDVKIFISNGVELGYIKMPDKNTLDKALLMSGIVDNIIKEIQE